jgi:hypothetical protein
MRIFLFLLSFTFTASANLQGGAPNPANTEELTHLLSLGLSSPNKCQIPIQPIAPTVSNSKPAWLIHSGGVGKLSADGEIPTWLLTREDKTLTELLTKNAQLDQDGFRIISPNSLDLKIRYSENNLIMQLYPGNTLRTQEGTGLGSTLAELAGAHGDYTMSHWPEPYHCGVHVRGYKGVSFAFDSCEQACAGGEVKQVIIAGKDPWGEAIVKAFIPNGDHCQWTHLNTVTGSPVASWSMNNAKCPQRAIQTKNYSSELFALKHDSQTPLWQLTANDKILKALPTIHNLEFAWQDHNEVYAITANVEAHIDLNNLEEDTSLEQDTPLTPEALEQLETSQWQATCYVYKLKDASWQLQNKAEVDTHEGMRGPVCADLVDNWSSTNKDYSGLLFQRNGISPDLIPNGKLAQNLNWGILFDLDKTRTGNPCGKRCKPSELVARYAFSIDWYEGYSLTGSVMSYTDSKWQPLAGLKGKLKNFFSQGEQIIFCTELGFGAWDHNTATALWWKNSPSCPLQNIRIDEYQ